MSLLSRRIDFLIQYENYNQLIKLMNPIIEQSRIFNKEFNFLENRERVFSLIDDLNSKYSMIKFLFNLLKKEIYDDNEEINSTLNTFVYYLEECKKEGKKLLDSYENFRSGNMNKVDSSRVCAVYYLMISAYMNFINSSYETMNVHCKGNKDTIVVFAALPIDQDFIDLDEEVKNIDYIFLANDSAFYPIIRMATTYQLFKNTCKQYKPKIIHFCCHGENNQICLLQRDGSTFLFNPDVFIKYYTNPNNGFSRENDVKLVYINSCYSDTFAAKIRRSKNSNVRFYKTIGYSGKLFDDFAVNYSKELYSLIYNKKDFCLCSARQRIKKNFNRIEESKICLCKR